MLPSLKQIVLLLTFAPLCAQEPAPIVRTTPRAARLTFFAGAVQIQRADNTGEDTPLLNLPLIEGTRIVAGDYGQAEIEFEDGSLVRLTPRSAVSLETLTLDSSNAARTKISLLGGLAYFELRKSPVAAYTVEAGNIDAIPAENLTLRVNLDEPPASFTILAGSAQLQSTKSTQVAFPTIRAGETLRPDVQDDSRYFLTSSVAPESWDQWNQSRDLEASNQAEARTSARDGFAASQGYGWSDLDASGTWYNVPGQGNIWQPAEAAASPDDAADFDPYANGAWVWSGAGSGSSAGYVFASAYTWGWTPYHCGRWTFYPAFGWGWIPNANCGQWGLGGAGNGDLFIFAGGGPPRRIPLPRPIGGPGSHPILPVRPPNRTHPPLPLRSETKIAGAVAVPLTPIGPPLGRHPNLPRQALERDFPVDSKNHLPVLGLASAPLSGRAPSASPGFVPPVSSQRTLAPPVPEISNRPLRNSDRALPTRVEPSTVPYPIRNNAPPSPRSDPPPNVPRSASSPPASRPAPPPPPPPPSHPAPPPAPPAPPKPKG